MSRNNASRSAGTVVGLMLLIFGAEREAWAQTADSTIAEALFRDGQQLMQRGEVDEACRKFAASQAAEFALGTLLNLAVCHEREGKTASAWTEFAAVRAEAARVHDEKRKRYAEARVVALEQKLRKLELRVPEPVSGAQISVDGHPISSAAWGTAIPVDPGEHTIEARAPGFQSWTQKQTLLAGPGTDALEIPKLVELPSSRPAPTVAAPLHPEDPEDVATTPRSAPVTSPGPDQTVDLALPPPTPAESPAGSRRTAGLLVGGAGVASVGVGVLLLLTAQSHANQRDSICAAAVPCKSEQDFHRARAEYESARDYQLAGLITGGVGLAAIGVGSWLFLSAENGDRRSAVRIDSVLGPHRGILQVTQAF